MTVWAIADLHLSFGVPDKGMEAFGEQWVHWTEKVAVAWRELVADDDLVLIAGDISWAKHLEDALVDLEWIASLPGTKVMIRGNHDYWWSAISKVRAQLPESLHVIQHNAFQWKGISIGGARLWDCPDFGFKRYIDFVENPKAKELHEVDEEQVVKVYQRELGRLEMSLKCLDQKAEKRIVMTHYPPLSGELERSAVSDMLEKYGVDQCVFGHLHNVRAGVLPFGEKGGVKYTLTSCDYLNFVPIQIL